MASSTQVAENIWGIEKMARRRANAFSYASASPYFIFRGFVWMAGCAAGDLMPLVLAGLWLRKV